MPRAIKKEEKKPAVKKTTAVKKAATSKYWEKVPETMVFFCNDGQVFDDLDQLMMGFELMSDDTYMYHANDNKNDFSCWILDVVGDEELATDIKKARTKTQAKEITQKRKVASK